MKYREMIHQRRQIMYLGITTTCIVMYTLYIIARIIAPSSQLTIRTCTDTQRAFQDQFYEVARVRGCPPSDDRFMRTIHMLTPNASVFVDIGSNKGYTSARFFQLWEPQMKISPGGWHKTIGNNTDCGACGDCKENTEQILVDPCSSPETHFKTSDPNKKHGLLSRGKEVCMTRKRNQIEIHAFDGSLEMVQLVQGGIDKMMSSKSSRWTVTHGAFTRSCIGQHTLRFNSNGELGSIDPNGSEQVPCMTVDSIVMKRDIKHIDILKMDTEGHDADVIMGARGTITMGIPSVIMFEYHKLWEDGKLDGVMNLFDSTGYVCYREGKNYLIRWSGGCISNISSQKSWSNVYCTRDQKIIDVFDSQSLAFQV